MNLTTRLSSNRIHRLAVIPGDPLDAYEQKGTSVWLEDYYNPCHMFDEVYLFSPLEKTHRRAYGMTIVPTKPRQLAERIREFDIDLVRAYGGHWTSDMACRHKVRGVPTVVSVHDSSPRMLHRSIRKADFVFCMSQTVKDLVLTRYRQEDNVWILPNRVNFDVMYRRQREEYLEVEQGIKGRYRLLHIGRRVREKNLDTLLRALALLGYEYSLTAIGQGMIEPYLEIARECRVSDRFYHLDSVKNEELPKYYSLADCFCTPSRPEGFGLVYIEALACGSIVVTSNIGPMNAYIKHGVNGLLVDDWEDPKALAKTIAEACTDQSVRRTLISNARDSVLRFEKKAVDELEAGYYSRILSMGIEGRVQVASDGPDNLLKARR